MLFTPLDKLPSNQLYIMFSAEYSGVQLGKYVVSIDPLVKIAKTISPPL